MVKVNKKFTDIIFKKKFTILLRTIILHYIKGQQRIFYLPVTICKYIACKQCMVVMEIKVSINIEIN